MASGTWTLTIRDGPHVERVRCDSLEAAVTALEQRVEDLTPEAHRDDVKLLRRSYEASQQVPVRAEITGPGGLFNRPRGGVDLHGDGSAEAFTGRLRRADVALREGESPFDGLRRVLGGPSPGSSATAADQGTKREE